MSLIECPECGREISSMAKSCPGCGYPILAMPIVLRDLRKYIKGGDYQLSSNLIRSPYLPDTLLRELACDNSDIVRREVAMNPSTPNDVLEKLARDRNVGIRCSVAMNASTPNDVLEKLARDKDEYVRQHANEALKTIQD